MEHPCSPPVPSTDPLARDPSVRRSLSARTDYVLIGGSLLVGAATAIILCLPELLPFFPPFHLDLGAHPLRFAVPIAAFPLLVTLVLISAVLNPWRVDAERGWLAGLPFPFAHRGYLTTLKRDPGTNLLQLLLVFDHQPAQSDFADLCKRRVPGSKVLWQDERTVLVCSPPKLAKQDAYTRGVYNNAPLHRWFRTVAAPFLVDLQKKAGLQKVEVRT